MTEIEKMQRAKIYIDKLANGINPIDGTETAENDVVNNVRVSRCLFYVSEVLDTVIKNGCGSAAHNGKKSPFSLTQEDLKKFQFSDAPIPVSEISKRLNMLAEDRLMTKLKYSSITSWLCEIEMLITQTDANGKSVKRPTAQGESIGITAEERYNQSGRYIVVVYNRDAQQFIIDNIDAIIAVNNQKKEREQKAEMHWQAWLPAHDECLLDLYEKGVAVSEIAITLKRTETGIRSRLKRLGIIESRNEI